MKGAAPLRFLAVVVGGWIGFRMIVLMPDWAENAPADVAARAAPAAPRAAAPQAAPATPADMVSGEPVLASLTPFRRWITVSPVHTQAFPAGARPVQLATAPFALLFSRSDMATSATPATPPTSATAAPPSFPLNAVSRSPEAVPPAPHDDRRWSGSAWLFLRDGGGGDLAPGGALGGSQAGARLTYRINGDAGSPLALSARLYAPIERSQGAEVALGIDWQPLAKLPIHLLAERRQRIGREGRSDFALSLYGGGERRLLGGQLRVEAYGQAGVVGIEERDLFADGLVRASARAGPVQLGAGIWGGAQPGASRLDAGPQASAQLSIAGTNIRASAEWRFRITGDAAPGSGPALTIGVDF